jgi:predicted aldo/keto reductase-like oxidoreductase
MRLPILDGRPERIDIPLATQMLEYALDQGVNYVDTAYPYHGASFDGTPGMSEAFTAGVLNAGGYRDRVLLATKLPLWLVEERKDMDRILDDQLRRMQTDRIDCYLLHALSGETWQRLVGLGVREFLDAAKADGRIRYAGFSYHDDPACFAPIVDDYDWDLCQIQYNFMDVDFQAGAAGLRYAAERGLGVVVMEPLKGGRLASPVPEAIQTLWDTAPVRRSAVEWALRFVWDEPGVSLLLSGMSTMEQVVENVALAAHGSPGSLTAEERELIARVRDAYKARTAVSCTGCGYCLPCPSGINIPLVLSCVNNAALFENVAGERIGYNIEVALGHSAKASDCTECGQCESVCPQKVQVIAELANAARMFESPDGRGE